MTALDTCPPAPLRFRHGVHFGTMFICFIVHASHFCRTQAVSLSAPLPFHGPSLRQVPPLLFVSSLFSLSVPVFSTHLLTSSIFTGGRDRQRRDPHPLLWLREGDIQGAEVAHPPPVPGRPPAQHAPLHDLRRLHHTPRLLGDHHLAHHEQAHLHHQAGGERGT